MATAPGPGESDDPGLSGREYALFALLFLFTPVANVLVSSILYDAWKRDRPRRARQINRLGFIVFGLQIPLYCLFATLLAGVLGGGGPRPP